MDLFKELDFYCERTSSLFWAEPLNTFSNIFFVLAGLYVLNRTFRVRNLSNLVWLRALSVIVVIVGVGSFLFHVYANTWSLLADMIPILAFMALYLSFILRKAFKVSLILTLIFVSAFIVTTLLIDQSFLKLYFNGSTTYFPAWMASCFIAQALYPKNMELSENIYGATFVLGISLFFRSVDMMFCDITISGTHYLWHMLNAVVLFSLLRGAYLFSKEPVKSPSPKAV